MYSIVQERRVVECIQASNHAAKMGRGLTSTVKLTCCVLAVLSFLYVPRAVCSTVLITRVAKDALEKAIEEHEGGVSDEYGVQMSDTVIRTASCGMASPNANGPQPFHSKLSPREPRQQMVLTSESNVKDLSKGVLVRIEGASLSSPKGEKSG